ncbi:uncharacterized protein Z519_09702 [Cladophialophora bantiana CBS 173.52]|uniref:Uncharacterized protein n=1 Tax=Cladophialophora bantiana (strain ATCC 10958 / CBS 173.52 / CDC B-1940 / NIH 8579) TaxID=1442370 RepID=A0A0D2EHN2_CLAB1|nr:uncharacterized protein Z519_09702 [Cladophialophora bantiana CBS 173.52]KIW89546.1 hypothetical protein Z519_09702 [Cladophialophora bantiana CBS 173.52]
MEYQFKDPSSSTRSRTADPSSKKHQMPLSRKSSRRNGPAGIVLVQADATMIRRLIWIVSHRFKREVSPLPWEPAPKHWRENPDSLVPPTSPARSGTLRFMVLFSFSVTSSVSGAGVQTPVEELNVGRIGDAKRPSTGVFETGKFVRGFPRVQRES